MEKYLYTIAVVTNIGTGRKQRYGYHHYSAKEKSNYIPISTKASQQQYMRTHVTFAERRLFEFIELTSFQMTGKYAKNNCCKP